MGINLLLIKFLLLRITVVTSPVKGFVPTSSPFPLPKPLGKI